MFDANKLLNQMLGRDQAQGATQTAAGAQNPLDDIGGLLGSLFRDSVAGMKEGAAELEKQTGVGARADSALRDATGRSTGELLDQAKTFAKDNRIATTAALGGLGALLLGTKGGRGILGGGATLGGLAMIGGLAYKAYRDHQAKTAPAPQQQIAAPPAGSPFGETGDPKQDNETSMLILRAMIAAAASDGTIDGNERSRIIAGLEKAGLDREAARFLDREIEMPATVAELAAAARSPALAAQAYTAARIAIDPDSKQERAFLEELAGALNMHPGLVAQIEAGAGGR